MVRSVLGVVIGAIVWAVGFLVLAQGLALLWPGYAVHGRQWMKESVFTFTAAMACCNLWWGSIWRRCISFFTGRASRGGTTSASSFRQFRRCGWVPGWQTGCPRRAAELRAV